MATTTNPHQSTPYTFPTAAQDLRNGKALSQTTQDLLSELTPSERLSLLDGDVPFWPGLRDIICDRYNRVPFIMGSIPRLRIPGIRFTDGPRGVVTGSSTAFPIAMARGATWDTTLEYRVGQAIGKEAKAQGANCFAGICVNLPRHPAWGRIQETYGEDPILLGEFGVALMKGVQEWVMGCVKHFALNSTENARFQVDVQVEEDVLHEVYLAHFRRIVEGGVASVMSSYNSVNGEWAGQNRELLTDILREQWKFDGFVISDFIFGLRDAALSVKNGLDVEAPFIQQRGMHLEKKLESGELEQSAVGAASARILQKQIQFAATAKEEVPDMSVVFCKEHRDLAREVAARSMVLLKNDSVNSQPLLPLGFEKMSKIAVVGRLANVPNTGDKGSSQVFSPHVVTPYEGIKAAAPQAEIFLEESNSIENVTTVAKEADVVICVVGYDWTDEGEYVVPALSSNPSLLDCFPPAITDEEKGTLSIIRGGNSAEKADCGIEVGSGGDRRSLRLRPQDVEMIHAVTAANPRTIVSIVAAGAVIMGEWIDHAPAVLMTWYSGSEGGHALADVLLGKVDASGRLPFSIPKDESHLPFFDVDATGIKYDRWFGQSLLDKIGQQARFPLGFGLSYTAFSMSDLSVDAPDGSNDQDILKVQVRVSNNGKRAGRHVIQVYGLVEMPEFPSRVLLGFSPADLEAGKSRLIDFDVSTRPLQRYVAGTFVLPDKEVCIEAASYAGDVHASQKTILIGRRQQCSD